MIVEVVTDFVGLSPSLGHWLALHNVSLALHLISCIYVDALVCYCNVPRKVAPMCISIMTVMDPVYWSIWDWNLTYSFEFLLHAALTC